MLGEVDDKLGKRRSTTAHFEYLKEHVSQKDHAKDAWCFGRCL